MAIASVVQGTIETESGNVFDLDSSRGFAWVESVSSFRYVPTGTSKPYTVRQEAKKGGDYWYGYRKMAGRLHKKYIGKSSELSRAKLEEIAEALNTPQQSRVTQVTDTVTQVTELNNQPVTDTVTDRHTVERVTALELQVKALGESLEALRSELSGKSKALSNSPKLLNAKEEVTESELQNELSNLKAENEKLRTDYAALLESSTHVTNKLREEVRELRSQLETERANREEVEAEREELAQLKKQVKEHALEVHREGRSIELEKDRWQGQLSQARADLAAAQATIVQQKGKILELERGYTLKPNPAERRLRLEIGELQTELSDLKQKSAAAGKDLPEAAELLNQLKAKRKKSSASLADVELILEMIEESCV
jgi:chromosome segregation ATPase